MTYDERQQKRKKREEQIEQDRRDFDRLFRVSTSRRDAPACSDFSAYAAFIRNHLGISGLSAPVDGDDVTRILRDAVRDGRLVPAVSRAWRGGRRVSRLYAPQSWPKRAPDRKPTVYGVRDGQFVPLDANGYFIDRTPYVPVPIRSRNASDWLAAVETVAGAMPGVSDSDGTWGIPEGFTNGEGSTLLGKALPFEYKEESGIPGDETQTAWLPITGGPANTWIENPSGSGQMRLYDSNGNAAVDLDFDHDHGFGVPHSHNWNGGARDKGNRVSILPC
ncbi:hypothetical protein [Paraburkholderia sacchari]|uniref:hypothetical protein n=1 Tax=Paraburkholderia sacchari TaxID=159450 RepID=UPI0039A4A58A